MASSSGVGVGRCGFPSVKRGAPQFRRGCGAVSGRGLSVWESALWPVSCWQFFWTDWPSIHLPSASLREAISYPRRCSALATPCTHQRLQGNQGCSGHTWATQVQTTGGQGLGLRRIFFCQEVPRGAQSRASA